MSAVRIRPPPLDISNKRRLDLESSPSPKKQKRLQANLRIEIPPFNVPLVQEPSIIQEDSLFSPLSDTSSEVDSLFDEPAAPFPVQSTTTISNDECISASRSAPPIPGFYFDPSIRIPQALADRVLRQCMETYFKNPNANQAMLFGRAPSAETPLTSASPPTSFPLILNELLSALADLLHDHLPTSLYTLLFPASPTRARQAIINLYHPGEGISPHVDLLRRFGDGIIGVSFGSGCVMRFDRVHDGDGGNREPCAKEVTEYHGSAQSDRYDLYLPERSVMILSDDARYIWTHGIERRLEDIVEGAEPLPRGTRMSITFRWLLPGAEIVGDTDGSVPSP